MCSTTPAKGPARQWSAKERGDIDTSHSSHLRSSTTPGGPNNADDDNDANDADMAAARYGRAPTVDPVAVRLCQRGVCRSGGCAWLGDRVADDLLI
jgi:hypothetical protein